VRRPKFCLLDPSPPNLPVRPSFPLWRPCPWPFPLRWAFCIQKPTSPEPAAKLNKSHLLAIRLALIRPFPPFPLFWEWHVSPPQNAETISRSRGSGAVSASKWPSFPLFPRPPCSTTGSGSFFCSFCELLHSSLHYFSADLDPRSTRPRPSPFGKDLGDARPSYGPSRLPSFPPLHSFSLSFLGLFSPSP